MSAVRDASHGAAEAEPSTAEPEDPPIEVVDPPKEKPGRGKRKPVSNDTRRTIAEGARAAEARRHFRHFLRYGWEAEEGEPIEWSPQLEALCDHLQCLFEGWLAANGKANPRQLAAVLAQWQRHALDYKTGELLVQNLNVNMPPGTLKSTVVMVYWPAWIWLHAPKFGFACACSNDAIWKRDSRAHAKLVQGQWYRRTFRITWTIDKTQTALGEWATTAGGRRISRSLGQGFIGLHLDGILIDDPDDPLRVWNEPERRRVQEKWTKVIANRVMHPMKSIRVVLQQRVHSEDLSAYLRAKGQWAANDNRSGWVLFCVPMVMGAGPEEVPEVTAFGWRDPRAKGETLSPERFPESFLAAEKRDKGTHGYNSLYNQNPETLDGGMFDRGWFRFFRLIDNADNENRPRPRPEGCSLEAPLMLPLDRWGNAELDFLTITVDASFGSKDPKKASRVGLLVFGGRGVNRFVFDDKTEPMTFNETIEAILALITRYPARRVLIETKANGPAIIETLDKAMREAKVINRKGNPVSIVVEGFDPGQDTKVARARAMMPDIEAGILYLLDGAIWLADFLKEVCTFRENAPKDDRVDALSQAMIHHGAANDAAQKFRAAAKW